MALDLGEILGSVDLIITPFERKYNQVVGMMAKLGANAERAGGQTTPLERALAGVAESSNAATTGLGRVDKALAEAGVSSSRVAASVRTAAAATTEAERASSRLTQATLRQEAAQARLTAVEESEKATTAQLASAQAALIGATDRVAVAQERAGKATGFTSDAWQSAGHKMLLTGGLIAAGFAYAAHAAVDFDAKMALVQTLARASTAEMGQLRKAALTVGQQYGFTAGQVADAEAELVKAGVGVKDIMGGALTGALTLAAAGQENVAEATETATIAMTQFGLKGKDVPHIADLLAAGADKALGSVSDLSEALKYGGLAAAQAGFSINETVGTLAEFAQAGLMGSSAGSTLQQMLRALEKPNVEAAAKMRDLGISIYDANGQMISSSKLAGELHDKIGTLPEAQRNAALATIFSTRAIRGANILMKDGAAVNREWIATVNAQGFAALQAAGKMNSLSGDLTKLKAALQQAFIGAGEGAQGPLRTITQDVTKAVEAWNRLPQPVKSSVEEVGAAGAALLIAGGAMITLIPKIKATKDALAEMSISGSRVASIMGKGGLFVGAIGIAAAAVSSIDDAIGGVSYNADAMSASLTNLAKTSQVSGELTKAFGANLDDLKSKLSLSGGGVSLLGFHFHSLSQTFTHSGSDFKNARDAVGSVDQALTDLAQNGSPDIAQQAWNLLAQAAQRQGISLDDLAKKFPLYSGYIADTASQTNTATDAAHRFQSALAGQTGSLQDAAAAADTLGKNLHALADPLFAEQQALEGLRQKQDAYNKAVKQHGESSRAAKQALQDLASASLNAEAASAALTAAVQDGTVSLHDARHTLNDWVKQGSITRAEANRIALAWGGLINKADAMSGAVDSSVHHFQAWGSKAGAAAAAMVAHVLTELAAGKTRIVNAGVEFSSGFAAGITDGQVKAIHAAAVMGILSYQAAKNAIESRSPSRLLRRLGRDGFGLGFALGIDDAQPIVMRAAARLAKAAAAVTGAIAAAVAPQVTDSSQLAGMLTGDRHGAIRQQQAASSARQTMVAAQQNAHHFDQLAKAVAREAAAADKAAQKAKQQADAMKSSTAAQKAAKKAAEESAKSLAAQAKDVDADARMFERWAKVADRSSAQASKAYGKVAQAAQDATAKATEAAQQLVASLQSNIDTLSSEVSDFVSQVAQGVTGDYSLSTIWQNLADTGNQTVAGVQDQLDQVLASATKFKQDLDRLQSEGASQSLIEQLTGMGPEGDTLAQQLLAAGPGAVGRLSGTLDAIASMGQQAGDDLAKGFYGSGISAMEHFVKGLMHEFPELRKALRPLLTELSSVFSGSPAKIPGFASGVTNFRGGLAMVGENGPEVLRLPAGSNVYPHGSDGAALGMDLTPVVDRLDRIERRLAVAPTLTGEAVGAVTLTGFREAGAAQARMITRIERKGG